MTHGPRANEIILEDVIAICALPLDWERLKGRSVLVAGAYGFLPAYIIETLLYLNTSRGLGCNVTGLVRDLEKAKQRFGYHGNRGDLQFLKSDVATGSLGTRRQDIVIHAASNASPRRFRTDPVGIMTSNFYGAKRLLDAAREWNTEAFLYFSSGEVYGALAAEQIPTAEDQYGYIDITSLRSCYALAKQATEALGISYLHQHSIPFKIARPFHTYGPGMSLDDDRVFAEFVRHTVRGEDIVMRSDGSAVRAFCYLRDAVAGYFTILLNGVTGIPYNVGNPHASMSIRQLAELVLSLRGESSAKIVCDALNTLDGSSIPAGVSIPDISRLKSLGWSPQMSAREGFARTIEFYTS